MSKASKSKADNVSKELITQNKKRIDEEKQNGCTIIQRSRTLAADRKERTFLVNEALVEDSHFNFPKMHLMIHWADQISWYGCLPQYSTEVYKTSNKELKDAY